MMYVIEPLRPNTSFYMLLPPLSFSPLPPSAANELGLTQHHPAAPVVADIT